MSMGPTPEQVATQVAMLRRQRPEASIIAIHTPGTWLGGAELRIDGEHLPVAHSTVVIRDGSEPAVWWTFAGFGANAALAHALSQATQSAVDYDSFALTFASHVSRQTLEKALQAVRAGDVSRMRAAVDEQAIEGLKFSGCLPHELALDMLQSRLSDAPAIAQVLQWPVRFVWA